MFLMLNRILNALTQALQSSGMDLSQASISVQIDVGKRANSGFYPAASGSEVCLLKRKS